MCRGNHGSLSQTLTCKIKIKVLKERNPTYSTINMCFVQALNMSESESCSGDPGITREEANKKLIASAKSGDHEGVSRALGEGAEITYRDSNGITGLHYGAYQGHDNVVKTFLEAGIDVNLNSEGRTKWNALIIAANFERILCLHVLDKYRPCPVRGGHI